MRVILLATFHGHWQFMPSPLSGGFLIPFHSFAYPFNEKTTMLFFCVHRFTCVMCPLVHNCHKQHQEKGYKLDFMAFGLQRKRCECHRTPQEQDAEVNPALMEACPCRPTLISSLQRHTCFFCHHSTPEEMG